VSDTPLVASAEVHNPELRHHFADMEQQREASEMGMWVFLITEIMFFGGLFCGYMIYRYMYYPAWEAGSELMDFWWGTINTVVLICSSLTMALAVRAAQVGQRKALVWLLIITMLFGCAFLGIKGIEYTGHWRDHQFPGPSFHVEGPDAPHIELFFSFYWGMTGLHALHMLIGVGIVAFITFYGWRGLYGPDYFNPVENAGLYWHFVDAIWIFLYPLLYLISHNHPR
jgi:cytochrome c oxidase subunit III